MPKVLSKTLSSSTKDAQFVHYDVSEKLSVHKKRKCGVCSDSELYVKNKKNRKIENLVNCEKI